MAWKFTIGSDPGTPPNATGPDSDARVLTVTDLNGNNTFTVDATGKLFANNGLQIAGGFTLPGGTPSPLQVLRSHYSFAAQGGTIGVISLNGATVIPAGSTVLGGYYFVTAAPDSAGHTATIALSVESANDLLAAVVVSNAAWTTLTTRTAIIPVFTAATAVVTTVARDVKATIAVQNLTVGTFDVITVYVPGA